MVNRRALFISHGGGPLPLLGDPAHDEMVACLKGIAAGIERPSAVCMVANREAPRATVTTAKTPHLLYDYTGFPEDSYAITYDCPSAESLPKALSTA